jgi:hypothetical protein
MEFCIQSRRDGPNANLVEFHFQRLYPRHAYQEMPGNHDYFLFALVIFTYFGMGLNMGRSYDRICELIYSDT